MDARNEYNWTEHVINNQVNCGQRSSDIYRLSDLERQTICRAVHHQAGSVSSSGRTLRSRHQVKYAVWRIANCSPLSAKVVWITIAAREPLFGSTCDYDAVVFWWRSIDQRSVLGVCKKTIARTERDALSRFSRKCVQTVRLERSRQVSDPDKQPGGLAFPD